MTSEIFLDTAYALALSSVKDQFHARAVAVAQQLKAGSATFITTRSVLLEIGDSLAKLRYRPAALQLLRSLEVDPELRLFPYRMTCTFAACSFSAIVRIKSGD